MQPPFSKELSGLSFPSLLAFSVLCALLLFREVAIMSNWEETPVECLCAGITGVHGRETHPLWLICQC